jgi:serine protein kinase
VTLANDYLSMDKQPELWQGDFAEYLELVLSNPKVARSAHALLYDAIIAKGIMLGQDDRPPVYGAFADEVFGIDEPLSSLMKALHAGAEGLDIRRRIILLMGPPGSAKSTIATHLKRLLEQYTRTPEGTVYAIAGCPMHEDPLHLLPYSAREKLYQDTGIVVEGELCPVCRYHQEQGEGTWASISTVRVEQITFSEQRKVGIAAFAPSDPNSQDISDLVGGVDIVALQKYGVESHPLAWRFDGTLNIANRGIAELIELLKSKSELQFSLLTLAQERQIKAPRFELISADEVLLAHTNEEEYRRFVSDQKNEALQSRTYVIKVPYNLQWSAEERIYTKMMGNYLNNHIAPWTLKAAAGWALLSRYEKLEKYSPALKLKLYDGQFEGEYRPAHLREVRELSPRDGMFGISPRQVVNALSQAMAASADHCLTPTDALKALRESLDHHTGAENKEKRDELLSAVGTIRAEYDKWAKETVSRAFIAAFESSAQNILVRYLDSAEASVREDKLKDPVTSEWVDPDEKLMRSLEDLIGVSEASKKSFREELLVRVGALARHGKDFRWDSHPRLKEAIEQRLFADLQGTIRTTLSNKVPDDEQQKKLEVVKDRLKEQEGFCHHCSSAILDYVGYLLEKGN